jgi:hypothetical protein
MADLVIWQLLKFFKNILRSECRNEDASLAFRNATESIMFTPWVLNWSHSSATFSLANNATYFAYTQRIPHLLADDSIAKYSVVALLMLYSPWIARPLNTGTLAILCNRPTGNSSLFSVHSPLRATSNDDWLPLNIVALIRAGCAGWKHAGNREHNRIDDEHIYVPTATNECPTGSVPSLGEQQQQSVHVRHEIIVTLIYFQENPVLGLQLGTRTEAIHTVQDQTCQW